MYGGREYNPPPLFFSPSPNPFNQIHYSTHVPSKQDAEMAWLKSVKAKQLDAAKGFKAQMVWLNTSEAKQRAAAAKAHAILEFKKRFPRANISKFQVQVDFDTNLKATGEVLFKESDGSLTDPLIADRKCWSQPLKDALQMHQDGGFPFQLTLIHNPIKPIPAVTFYEKTPQLIGLITDSVTCTYCTPMGLLPKRNGNIHQQIVKQVKPKVFRRGWNR